MAKDLETILEEFVSDVTGALGESLQSAVLYGSAVTGEYVARRSDLNILLVVEPITLEVLDRFQKRVGSWSKRRISTPLTVQRSFLGESTDSYPLEILGMMAAYRILAGSDPFTALSIEKEHVRLQVEREVKAKTLLLRRGYMESCGKQDRLMACLAGALPALDAILRGILYLRDADWKQSGEALHASCAEVAGVDREILDKIRDARSGKLRPDRAMTVGLYGSMLDTLLSLARMMEQPEPSA